MQVLVTGSSSKISQGIADFLEKKSHQVFCTSSDPNKDLFFNLANPDFTQIEKWLSQQNLGALILNAASPTTAIKTLHKIPFEEASAFLKNNIDGNLYLLQKILPYFVERKMGRIVFISSQTVPHVLPGYSIYSAAKAALESLMSYVAVEYGKYNITANTLRLGIIKTDRNERFRERKGAEEKMTSRISLGRLGEPQDVAEVIEVLLSPTSYVNGSIIDVSGGFHIPG